MEKYNISSKKNNTWQVKLLHVYISINKKKQLNISRKNKTRHTKTVATPKFGYFLASPVAVGNT